MMWDVLGIVLSTKWGLHVSAIKKMVMKKKELTDHKEKNGHVSNNANDMTGFWKVCKDTLMQYRKVTTNLDNIL